MSDRPLAALITTATVAPLMVVCCLLGPAAIAWLVAWASAWFAGVDAVAGAGLAIVAAMLVFALTRRRRAKAAAAPGSAVGPTCGKDRS